MVSAIKYWFRCIMTMCLIAAMAFLVTCAVLVVYFAVKSDIKIRMISGDEECEDE